MKVSTFSKIKTFATRWRHLSFQKSQHISISRPSSTFRKINGVKAVLLFIRFTCLSWTIVSFCILIFPFWFWRQDMGPDFINSWALPIFLRCVYAILKISLIQNLKLSVTVSKSQRCSSHRRSTVPPVHSVYRACLSWTFVSFCT